MAALNQSMNIPAGRGHRKKLKPGNSANKTRRIISGIGERTAEMKQGRRNHKAEKTHTRRFGMSSMLNSLNNAVGNKVKKLPTVNELGNLFSSSFRVGAKPKPKPKSTKKRVAKPHTPLHFKLRNKTGKRAHNNS